MFHDDNYTHILQPQRFQMGLMKQTLIFLETISVPQRFSDFYSFQALRYRLTEF